MTEPQIWTMIGAVIALMFGVLAAVSTLFVRVLRAEIGGVTEKIGSVSAEIGGLRAEMIHRFEAVDARFDAVNTRIDGVDRRIDGIDRDVRVLVKHTFGLDRE